MTEYLVQKEVIVRVHTARSVLIGGLEGAKHSCRAFKYLGVSGCSQDSFLCPFINGLNRDPSLQKKPSTTITRPASRTNALSGGCSGTHSTRVVKQASFPYNRYVFCKSIKYRKIHPYEKHERRRFARLQTPMIMKQRHSQQAAAAFTILSISLFHLQTCIIEIVIPFGFPSIFARPTSWKP